MAKKAREAFRTISEVAEWLDVPAHVLRFWESKFSQIKPVKRAGGRRYYRPTDMQLIGGIKRLLHDDGLTIRGVQKLLKEEGVKHVAGFSQPVDAGSEVNGERQAARERRKAMSAAQSSRTTPLIPTDPDAIEDAELVEDPAPADLFAQDNVVPISQAERPDAGDDAPQELERVGLDADDLPETAATAELQEAEPELEAEAPQTDDAPELALGDMPAPEAAPSEPEIVEQPVAEPVPEPAPEAASEPASAPEAQPEPLPEAAREPEPLPEPAPAPEPVIADLPDLASITAGETALARLAATRRIRGITARPDPKRLRPLHDRLVALRNRLSEAIHD